MRTNDVTNSWWRSHQSPDYMEDDQFPHANDGYNMAGRWFAALKLFKGSHNIGYNSDRDLINSRERLRELKKTSVSTYWCSSLLIPTPPIRTPFK
jgi:hypothetical protein